MKLNEHTCPCYSVKNQMIFTKVEHWANDGGENSTNKYIISNPIEPSLNTLVSTLIKEDLMPLYVTEIQIYWTFRQSK